MTVCTKHEYAGPKACPYCRRDLWKRLAKRQRHHARLRRAETREAADGWVHNFNEALKGVAWTNGWRARWKRLAKKQRAEALQNHLDQALADGMAS